MPYSTDEKPTPITHNVANKNSMRMPWWVWAGGAFIVLAIIGKISDSGKPQTLEDPNGSWVALTTDSKVMGRFDSAGECGLVRSATIRAATKNLVDDQEQFGNDSDEVSQDGEELNIAQGTYCTQQ